MYLLEKNLQNVKTYIGLEEIFMSGRLKSI